MQKIAALIKLKIDLTPTISTLGRYPTPFEIVCCLCLHSHFRLMQHILVSRSYSGTHLRNILPEHTSKTTSGNIPSELPPGTKYIEA